MLVTLYLCARILTYIIMYVNTFETENIHSTQRGHGTEQKDE